MGELEQSCKKLIIKIYSSCPQKCEGVCELKNKKGYAKAIWVDTKIPLQSGARNQEIRYKGCDERKKKERLSMECKKREKHAMAMDKHKKMQCWVMLKRLMVGRDAWIFKKSDLGVHKNLKKKKTMSLHDIESKLKRLEYSKVDEFEDDMVSVFSYPLGYPPRSEIHKIATRITQSFELTWKTMKKRWIVEENL
ncbi:hypothetical protein PHAVU_011G108200 [Phaseolus vulgaris]|uniref:Bromo domain-containing protein n=1 Tax=Phaseolus vulgaris TaxID=3885 RepID=V7AGA1_PHAVU|nr:hypothetical protein PHAVU_011G108200g [Phaseolus vulgaris]ESW04589.1 hypothetical protein PHAVU_011G108200g [Phaseolus vulgaris]